MKNLRCTCSTVSSISAGALLLLSSAAHGAVAVTFDSNAGPTTAGAPLTIILIEQAGTDASLVSNAITTVGAGVTNQTVANNNQMNVTANGNVDAMFEFGSGPFNDPIATSLANGNYLEFAFTAASDIEVDGFSFNLFVNNQGGAQYAARDSGLFYSVAGSAFIAFDTLNDQNGVGQRGPISFTDSFTAAAGENVAFRLAFTDRTRSAQDPNLLTETTRVGNVQISAVPIPEPTTALLGGLGVLTLLRRRRG